MAYKSAISSMSLGQVWVHELPKKLNELSSQQFQGIEVFYGDLEHLAKSLPGGLTSENQLEAARQIRQICDADKLEVISLGPFDQYEGLVDRQQHARKIEELQLWFQLIKVLGTDVVQIPSSCLQEGVTGDKEQIVKDMLEIAELGLKEFPVVRFAYENLCWGKFVNTWEQAWDIVAAVSRPNFGMCLDTFNIAGREWADPASADGKIPNADEVLRTSLTKMKRTVDVRKVFYVQVVDGERMRDPLRPGHPFFVNGHPPRMDWSRNARCFPFEEPGYLPVIEVLKAITTDPDGLGYRGWVSLELFSRTTANADQSCPAEHARRGAESWSKLVNVMGWENKNVNAG